MTKPKIIISAIGMPEDQRKQIEKDLNDPTHDQYVWVFDKPITVTSVDDVNFIPPNRQVDLLEESVKIKELQVHELELDEQIVYYKRRRENK